MATRIDDLWYALHRLEPKSELGGIYAPKRGYHNKRQNLQFSDYSVGEFALDRKGPADEASAIDWTFSNAQRGDYSTISKYSKRLYAAGKAKDPRTKYMREFFGNTDNDRHVEGYDFSKERDSSSDSSHLWHIHMSIHRAYINDPEMVRAIISILKGEPLAAYLAGGPATATAAKPAPRPTAATAHPSWPLSPTFSFKPSMTAAQAHALSQKVYVTSDPSYSATVKAAQARLKTLGHQVSADGLYGPASCKAVRTFQEKVKIDIDGLLGPVTWRKMWE